MRQSIVRRGVVLMTAAVALLVVPSALAAGASARAHGRPNLRISHGTSNNWSGYALTGAGPYKSVSASWTQPAVDCATTRTGWSAFWIGIDGDTSASVEQTGSEADCSAGRPSYSAWFEMYPRYPVTFAEPVSPGDDFTAAVQSLTRGRFKLTLSDTTQGWSRTVIRRLRSAALGSAEAIAEAPSSGLGVLPLADFETVDFSGLSVNGSLVSASTPGTEPITMESAKGATEAQPSTISDGSFSDTWYSQ
jgi:hypothetical protein